MTIQRRDFVFIVPAIIAGAAGMWYIAPSWWAVIVGIVCGAAAGTIIAIQMRITRR